MVGRPNRSFLYVPGERADRVQKATTSPADAVLIDLEDAVAPSARDTAREVAIATLRESASVRPSLWVRINPGDVGIADLDALAAVFDHVDGLVLAKCESRTWVDKVALRTAAHIGLAPLIESARAMRQLDQLCTHSRVVQCHLGEIDLLADLGTATTSRQLIEHARVELVYASAAAAILPPIGGVHVEIRNLDALASDSAHLVELGFAGRPAIHPTQVEVINRAFTPSAQTIAEARKLVERYDDALLRGVGVATSDDGSMVDEAVVRRARDVLRLAERVS